MVSLDTGNNPAPSASFTGGTPSISDDGRVIAFYSTSQLAPNSVADTNNLYLRDTCRTESGTVANCSPSTVTASVTSDGNPANAASGPRPSNPHILSGTGRFVVFTSDATNLVPGSPPSGGVYVRDTCIGVVSGCTPSTVMVSLEPTQDPANPRIVQGLFPVISSDGHFCAFMESGPGSALDLEQAVLARTSF